MIIHEEISWGRIGKASFGVAFGVFLAIAAFWSAFFSPRPVSIWAILLMSLIGGLFLYFDGKKILPQKTRLTKQEGSLHVHGWSLPVQAIKQVVLKSEDGKNALWLELKADEQLPKELILAVNVKHPEQTRDELKQFLK